MSGVWTPEASFELSPGKECIAFSENGRPYVDSSGDLFVPAGCLDASNENHWMVLRYRASTGAFTAVDDVDLFTDPGVQEAPVAIVGDGAGTLWAAGNSFSVLNTAPGWLIRKSTDGGQSWTTLPLPLWQKEAGQEALLRDLYRTQNGDLYAMGSARVTTAGGQEHAVVKRSSDGGATWTDLHSAPIINATQILSAPDLGYNSFYRMHEANDGTLFFAAEGAISGSGASTAMVRILLSDDTWAGEDGGSYAELGKRARAFTVWTDSNQHVYKGGRAATSTVTQAFIRRLTCNRTELY